MIGAGMIVQHRIDIQFILFHIILSDNRTTGQEHGFQNSQVVPGLLRLALHVRIIRDDQQISHPSELRIVQADPFYLQIFDLVDKSRRIIAGTLYDTEIIHKRKTESLPLWMPFSILAGTAGFSNRLTPKKVFTRNRKYAHRLR